MIMIKTLTASLTPSSPTHVAVMALALSFTAGSAGQTVLAGPDLETVALSGDNAPGADTGVTFSNTTAFGNPVINANGQVAFRGTLAGTDVTSSNSQGIYRGGPGTLTQVARAGDSAPGAGVTFSDFDRFSPRINASGQVVFSAGLTSGGDGIYFSDSSGMLTEVVREGDSAPGAGTGVTFTSVFRPVFNAAGQVAFKADLTGTGVDASNESVLFRGGAGTLSMVAREGGPAPGAGDTFIDQTTGSFSDPFANNFLINASGQVVFSAEINGPANESGIYRSDSSGVLTEVARTGDPAPGAGTGVTFTDVFSNGLNAAGQVLFSARLTGGDDGIYLSDSSGMLTEVVREGDSAPGAGTDVTFSFLNSPVINATGQTAFISGLDGPNVTLTDNVGLYRSDSLGTLIEVAREGAAPGIEGDVTFTFDDVEFTLNASGQVAFQAGLFGESVTQANDDIIYATNVDGVLVKIARTGDLLDVDDDPLTEDLRTIVGLALLSETGNADGRPSGLNDLGQIAFRAVFDDSSEGIFISNLVTSIPEPASALLMTVAAPLLLLRRRK